MAGKIFVNYRREDSASQALNVAQYLEKTFGRQSIFIDIDRMRAGENFREVLEERLASCKVMVVIIGPNWLNATDDAGRRRLDDPNDWVRTEISRAIARKIVVIPVLVGGAELPNEAALPMDIQTLAHRQAASITTNNFRNDMAGLVRDIQYILGGLRPAIVLVVSSVGALMIISVLTLLYVTPFLSWYPFSSNRDQKKPREVSIEDAAAIKISDSILRVLAETEAKRQAELKAQLKTEQDARRKAEDEAVRQAKIASKAMQAQEAAQAALKEAASQVEAAATATIEHQKRQAAAEAETKRQAELAAEATANLALAAKAAAKAKQEVQEVVKGAKSEEDARLKAEAEAKRQSELAARAIARYEAARKAAAQARQKANMTAKAEAEQKERQKAAEAEYERQAIVAGKARLKEQTAKKAAAEARRKEELKQVTVEAESRQNKIDTAPLIPDWSSALIVRGISVSPDNSMLAAAYDDGYVRLWRSSDLKLVQAFNASPGTRVNAVAFSSDGKKLASASWDGFIKLWDIETGSLIQTFKDDDKKVYAIAFYPGPQEYLASGHEDGALKIWNLRSRRKASDLQAPGNGAYAVAYRPGSNEFVYSVGRGGIRYMRAKGGHVDLPGAHSNSVLALAFAASGDFFVSAGYDGIVKIWNADDRTLLQELRGHTRYVLSVALSANGGLIASGGGDKGIRIWDASSRSEIALLGGHLKDVESLAFLLDDKYLLSSSEDRTLKVWKVAERQQVAQIIAFSGKDGQNYLVASAAGKFFAPKHAEQFIKFSIDGSLIPLSNEIRARRKSEHGVNAVR